MLLLDWELDNSKIISFDKQNTTNFTNRQVTLLDNLYFKLLVSKKSFDLSIFDVTNQQLLKQYAYQKDQQMDIIYGSAKRRKTKTFYWVV